GRAARSLAPRRRDRARPRLGRRRRVARDVLSRPRRADRRRATRGRDAWGHRHGIEYGANRDALRDLLDWLELAAATGARLVRCVAASARFRGLPYLGSVEPLAVAAARAGELGLVLALENHGDLRAAELLDVVERVDAGLGVCFDTANALRV